MNSRSELRAGASNRARWVAAGFLGAFAASVLTVVYTGLMVEGSRSEFDVGFRSVTLATGAVAELPLRFEVLDAVTDAELEVTLPAMLERVDGDPAPGSESGIRLQPGTNELAITVRAVSEGSGYVVARALAGEPVALERVFVTVTAD
jgi:hypothetical protein